MIVRLAQADDHAGPAGLDRLAATDLTTLDDQTLRSELLDLVTVSHRLHAEGA